MMRAPKITLAILALMSTLSFAARAQDYSPDYSQSPYSDALPPDMGAPDAPPADMQQQPAPPANPQQIDQLLAPVALYPDQLLGQVLMASTYPLEIVEASRWLQDPNNAQLKGDQLAATLEQQPWDPSVKSLVAFPQVLSMMDHNLPWTEQLGDAFLGQQAAVSESVQRLRQRAQAQGNLASTPQETVESDQGDIVIQPAEPQVVYVPVYNPTVVYGPWPYASYPPYYFPPPPGYLYASTGIIGFGIGIGVADLLWGWDRWDWHRHRIDIDDRRFEAINRGRPPAFTGGVWAHDPAHRHGVPYSNRVARAQFQGQSDTARRDNFRGFANPPSGRVANPGRGPTSTPAARNGRPSAFERSGTTNFHTQNTQRGVTPQIETHTNETVQQQQPRQQFQRQQVQSQQQPHQQFQQQRQSAPVFESFSRGPDVRVQSQRGSYSRSTTPAPAPVQRSATPQMATPQAAPRGGENNGGGHGGDGHGGRHDDNSKNH